MVRMGYSGKWVVGRETMMGKGCWGCGSGHEWVGKGWWEVWWG